MFGRLTITPAGHDPHAGPLISKMTRFHFKSRQLEPIVPFTAGPDRTIKVAILEGVLMNTETSVHSTVQTIYKNFSTSICKHVMHIVRNQDDADDIMQEAWVRYLNVEGHAKIGNPRAFLRRIAVNLALDSLRHRHRKNAIFADMASTTDSVSLENIPTPETSVEDSMTYSFAFQDVMNELSELPPKCWKAFILNAVEGQTHVEVSEHMGLSVSTIEKYCRRALQSVRTKVPNIFACN
jgi:RNA polymerase sigma factor (sigma-70 family)